MSQPWREELRNRCQLELKARAADVADSVREYHYTHGYRPEHGTWIVPRDWCVCDLQLLGEIDWIEYITRKKFVGPKWFIYNHKFRGTTRPWLARGRNIYEEIVYGIVGRGYHVTGHGIEDKACSMRGIPDEHKFRVHMELPESMAGLGVAHGIHYGGKHLLDLSDDRLVLAYRRKPASRLYIVPAR